MKSSAKPIVVPLIGVSWTAVFLLWWWLGYEPLPQLEFSAQDWQTRSGRHTPPDDRLVLIGLDKPHYDEADFSEDELQREPALKHLQKKWPWSRAVCARLLTRLAEAGAKVIVFDLVLDSDQECDTEHGDDQLRDALEKYRDRVVVGYQISESSNDRGGTRKLILPAEHLVPETGSSSRVTDDRLGFVDVWPAADGIVRRVNYRLTGEQAGDIVSAEVILES